MFPSAGQNIAANSIQGTDATYDDVSSVIKTRTNSWFDEYKYTNPEVIKAYHSTGDP